MPDRQKNAPGIAGAFFFVVYILDAMLFVFFRQLSARI